MTKPPVPGCPLTAAELRIVKLIAEGSRPCDIHRRNRGVYSHLHQLRRKLKVTGTSQAVARCLEEGWIDAPVTLDTVDVLLRQVLKVLTRLTLMIEDEVEREPLTPTQRAYLKAFDDYCRTHDIGLQHETQHHMLDQLRVVIQNASAWRTP